MGQDPALYVIRVEGDVGEAVLDAFSSLAAQPLAGHTALTGYLDQSALYGVLAHLEALRLVLVDLRLAEADAPGP